jgi:hypothetical protein
MPFGNLSLFPEQEHRDRRLTPRSERRFEAIERREREENREHVRDAVGTVVVGAIALGLMGAMMKR